MDEDVRQRINHAAQEAARALQARQTRHEAFFSRDHEAWKTIEEICVTFADQINSFGIASVAVKSTGQKISVEQRYSYGTITMDVHTVSDAKASIDIEVRLEEETASIFGLKGSRFPSGFNQLLVAFAEKLGKSLLHLK